MTRVRLPAMPSAPLSVDIALTGRCNLQCKYCFYADEMAALSDLLTERWLAFFQELGRLAVLRVSLTGGEVFTRPDLFELIDGVIANHMRYSILTNGTLVTDKTVTDLTTGRRRVRLDSIQVSIDGSCAAIHNQSRPGSFNAALRGLRRLQEAGLPVTVRVTVNRHNVQDLAAIAHLLLDEIGLPSFSTNDVYACGLVERDAGAIMLTPGQRRQAMDTLLDLAARYDGRIVAQAGPLALARHFQTIEAGIEAGEAGVPGRGTLCACGGVFTKLAVLHDGTLVPCHNLSSLRLGTIGVDKVREVWQHHPVLNAVRERRSIPLQSLESCRDCVYQGFCTGGCPGGALFVTGELNARNPMDCYRLHRAEEISHVL